MPNAIEEQLELQTTSSGDGSEGPSQESSNEWPDLVKVLAWVLFLLLYIPAPIVAWVFGGIDLALFVLLLGGFALGMMALMEHEGHLGTPANDEQKSSDRNW